MAKASAAVPHKTSASRTRWFAAFALALPFVLFGAIELAAATLTLQRGQVHPTINYETPDPECDLDYVPNQAREQRVNYAISNSLGFGGHNTCLLIGKV